MSPDDFCEIGRIYREHGIQGFCKFYSYDGTALNLKPTLTYVLKSRQGETRNVKILEIKPHSRYFLLLFDCFHATSDVRLWRKACLFIANTDLDRSHGELYDHEWLGLALCCGGKVMGEIKEVVYTPQKQFLLVKDGAEKIIPYVREWIVDIDHKRGRVEMVLPEGL